MENLLLGSILLGGLGKGILYHLIFFFLWLMFLSRMVQKQAQTRILEGLKVSRNCPLLTHLFFADDSLFFLKANTGNCRRLVECIQRYCTASGQKVNMEKSSMVFSSNTPLMLRKEIEEFMGIKAIDNPGSYLGVLFL